MFVSTLSPLLASETPADGCQSDNDCLSTANSQCVDEKCVCKDNYREEDGNCLPSNSFVSFIFLLLTLLLLDIGAGCDDSSPCTIENAVCDTENVCSCNDGYVADDLVTCLVCKCCVCNWIETLNLFT